MKFRKKPVVIDAAIDAVQWAGKNFQEVKAMDTEGKYGLTLAEVPADRPIVIYTLEGNMEASLNDYVIRGVKGELYPCKPDIFEATYEPAEAAHA
jgi:hypothetical protein